MFNHLAQNYKNIFINFSKPALFRKLSASFLLISLFLPNVLIGQVQPTMVSPRSSPPKVEMPTILLAPPQAFQFSNNNYQLPSKNISFLTVGSIWDSITSLFTPDNSINSDNSGNSETSVLLSPPSTADLSRARLSPKNQTGGTSLYSRNFGWGTGLAGLSGRGLDAGFGISYNSLIWTKVGSDIVFNPNNDNVSPGFRFGFPVIEANYTDPLTGKNTFLMVTPSGGRAEFRQVDGTTDTFETPDSSYTQLKVLDANNLVIIATNGNHAFYQLKAGAFRTASIKDSNGNYITINHDNNGLLQSVTDTLGRVINVAYDGQGSPTTITQTRSTGTYTFATLSYENITLNTNFSGLTIVGTTNNATIKALKRITYSDGSYVNFNYNVYGQVWWIQNFAADNHQLNYVALNFVDDTQPQTDCPRIGLIRNWAENFNLDQNGAPQEVGTHINYDENQNVTIPNTSTQITGTKLRVVLPNGVISDTYVGNSGWMEGLPIVTEDWLFENSAWNRKRWTWTNYTQDNPSLGYILNPRVTETKVGDATNVSRTTIDYYTQGGNPQASLYGLVSEVKVYDTNQTSVLKRSVTEYNLDSNYTNRRIIGLPQKTELFDQSNALMSKVTYNYDEGNFSGTGQTISAINHDSTNYGAGFSYRGNLTSASKWDVTDPTNGSKAIAVNRIKYNITGNPVSSMDPLNREIKTSYTDNFDDNVNRNTFAYPTQVTDPANNSSTVKYKFDFGANVFASSPAPAGQSVGKQTQRNYDALGRLEREIVVNTGAYTRYEYPLNGIQSIVYSTITDINNNGADAADEVLSESFTDGAGRVLRSRTEHPGSAGGWSATLTEYDIMGRVKRSTVPTEVNSSWVPSGDDAAKGWTWNAQEYDWKGRVTRQINVDGTDKLFSYEGCGCAGGQITTISGELLAEGRRRQKVYQDILGRTYKTETLNWNGSVYSTGKAFFNGRDQVTTSRQYAGDDTSGTYQDTTMTYDGYGRLKTNHRPEQNSGTNTTYNYYTDDRIQQVVDARGATVNYTYDNRGLTTQVSTTSPNPTTIPVAPTVTYTYDNLGNRTSMIDGMGVQTYEYDQLSNLTAETRQFYDSLANAPLSSNRFKLEYGYSLSGQLKFYKDPYGQQINYTHDKVGRLSSVVGSTVFSGVTSYASNSGYRAWGGLKSLSYGNGMQMAMSFNNRLQASSYSLAGYVVGGGGYYANMMQKNYEYYADGSFKYLQDTLNPKFDRLNKYDHVGRISEGKSGAEARNQTASTPYSEHLPYRQSYQYNAFDKMTVRNNLHWGKTEWEIALTLLYFYDNSTNRISGWSYDADGRVLSGDGPEFPSQSSYDAAGQMFRHKSTSTNTYDNGTVIQSNSEETFRYYDGNGRELKRKVKSCHENAFPSPSCTQAPAGYFIKSSVLGNETISEVNSTGKKLKTYIKAGGTNIAWQTLTHATAGGTVPFNPPLEGVYFEYRDASGMSRRVETNTFEEGLESDPAEFDPMGGSVGTQNPYHEDAPAPSDNGECKNCNYAGNFELQDSSLMKVNGQQVKCMQDGMAMSCFQLGQEINSGKIGGMFGLIERGARMSAQPPQKIGEWERTVTTTPTQGDTNETIYAGTADKYKLMDVYADNNWSMNFAMIDISTYQQQAWRQQQNEDQKKVDQSIKDVKDIFKTDNECTRFFGLGVVAKIFSTENGSSTEETIYSAKPLVVADYLGNQLRENIGFLDAASLGKKGIGIQMSGETITVMQNGARFRAFERAKVNSQGVFLTTGKFGSYSGRTGRALAILHEIAHMIITGLARDKKGKVIGSTYLIPDDHDKTTSGGDSLSEANTTLIETKCKKELDALKALGN